MSIPEQERLITGMINENYEVTVKDFIEVIEEIRNIEITSFGNTSACLDLIKSIKKVA